MTTAEKRRSLSAFLMIRPHLSELEMEEAKRQGQEDDSAVGDVSASGDAIPNTATNELLQRRDKKKTRTEALVKLLFRRKVKRVAVSE